MDNINLYEFEDEQAFEDYLISVHFIGWEFFQEHLVTFKHQVVGLIQDGQMIGAAQFYYDTNEVLHIFSLFIKENKRRFGYGSELLNMICCKYKNKLMVKAKWFGSVLAFWLKNGFQFSDDDPMYLVK